MAKQTARKAGGSAKVTSIVKKVVEKPKSSYPYYVDEHEYGDDNKHNSLSGILDGEDVPNMEQLSVTKHLSVTEEVYLSAYINATEHTCGFIELGNLSAKYPKGKPKLLADLADEFVQNAGGYTMFMNTNGADAPSKNLEAALPLSKHWVKVKTYKNPGSGNMLTLWVTNN